MMNGHQCPRESEVVLAVKSHQWTDELRAHVSQCDACKETVEIASSLQALASDFGAMKPPVSHRVLWLRSQVTHRHDYFTKLDRFTTLAGFAAFILALLGTALWKWDVLEFWTSAVTSEPGTHLSLYIVAGCAAFLWVLTEELFRRDA